MQKITPFLWFDGNAEEAVNFYVSIFKDSKVLHVDHFTGDSLRFGAQRGGQACDHREGGKGCESLTHHESSNVGESGG